MFVMLFIALHFGVLSGESGWTFTNFTTVLEDPLYRDVALTTFQIATLAMLIQLAIAIPLAYVLAYKAGKFELGLLLFLVLADELNPMVRIYAWRMLLGREGLINSALMEIGLIDAPDRRAPLQQVRRDRRAVDELPDLHGDSHLCGDEGHRPEHVRGGARPRVGLVHTPSAGSCCR